MAKGTKAKTKPAEKRAEKRAQFPPTSMRLDPDLLYRVEKLKLESRRLGQRETTSEILNEALVDYLRKRGA